MKYEQKLESILNSRIEEILSNETSVINTMKTLNSNSTLQNLNITELELTVTQLENKQKELKSRINDYEAQMERYSKKGYSRKIAELNTLKKKVEAVEEKEFHQSLGYVISEFLPVMDELYRLQEKYKENEFAKKNYNALCQDMNNCLDSLGVKELKVCVGNVFDKKYMKEVEVVELKSDHYVPTQVLDITKKGYKFNEMVLRKSNVILGKWTNNDNTKDEDMEVKDIKHKNIFKDEVNIKENQRNKNGEKIDNDMNSNDKDDNDSIEDGENNINKEQIDEEYPTFKK